MPPGTEMTTKSGGQTLQIITVDTTNAASDKDTDARLVRKKGRGSDRRGARGLGREHGRDVAARDLRDALGRHLCERAELGVLETDVHHTVDDGDRGRDRATLADHRLDLLRSLEVLRPRHAVADDRALQRHNALVAAAERVRHLLRVHKRLGDVARAHNPSEHRQHAQRCDKPHSDSVLSAMNGKQQKRKLEKRMEKPETLSFCSI